VLRAQHIEIECRHQGRHRGARRLMPANLEPVAIWPQMIRVVNHPGREPQHLALQCGQARKLAVRLRLMRSIEPAFEGAQHHSTPDPEASLADFPGEIPANREAAMSPV